LVIPVLVLATCGTLSSVTGSEADGMAFFEKKVRPLLIEKCYDCHSPEHKVKGGLRLDSREGWQAGGDSGAAIIPHDPENSLFMKALTHQDRDLKMPPKDKLSESDAAVFREWIRLGAPDPREEVAVSDGKTETKAPDVESGRNFWAYQLPRAHPAPPVQGEEWPQAPADHFVLARLEAAGLKPAPDADAAVLARRLYFDLTGMPPTVEELTEFAALRGLPRDAGAKAYEKVVDRLLASPRFGERWGRHWLDISRFAESSGGGRTLPFKDAWRYRDYVINSFNHDVPLDRFIVEQLAGDLLPYATAEERRRHLVATGFLVLGPTNYEEQDKQVLRMDIVDEQMDTMGRAFLGMTLSCARCHDHKFDPIPAADYYALAGIFRSTRTLRNYTDNVAHWIDSPLPMDGPLEQEMQVQETKLAAVTQELAKARKELKQFTPTANAARSPGRPVAAGELPGIVVDDREATVVGDWKSSTRYPTYVGEGYLQDLNTGKGTKTLTFAPKLKESGRYEVWLSYMALRDRATNVPVMVLHADGEEMMEVDQTAAPTIEGRFVSLGQYRFVAGGEGFVLVSNEGTAGFVTADAVAFVPVAEAKARSTKAESALDQAKANPRLAEVKSAVKELEAKLKALRASGLSRPEAMTVLDDAAPEDCRIHIRGNVRNLGEAVPRGFLTVAQHGPAPEIPETESGRRQLAEWVANRHNPLTARVLVNRIWMWLHGEGLVRSVDNFGTTGERPSHPELLDTLAVEFMEDGWSLKRLVKRLVMSRTYQMSSQVHEAGVAADPDNRLLWRQNRRRMDAESIRDTILAVAGTLDTRLGGPNVDAGSVDANDGGAQNLEYNFVFTDTRRSVYTPAFRNKRLELFETFDFADINQPIGKRTGSTVAPQALYFLNHPFMVEQSAAAAARLLATGGDDGELMHRACAEILGRSPTGRELQLAREFTQVSASDEAPHELRRESWALLIQALFASVDFRYLN
jgi:hypothetical protein